ASTVWEVGALTGTVGTTTAATAGGGARVGADGLGTATVAGPEVELRGAAGVAVGLDLQATDLAVANLALLSFGSAVASDASAAIRVGAAAHRPLPDPPLLGAPPAS